jgi:hypothetical protein
MAAKSWIVTFVNLWRRGHNINSRFCNTEPSHVPAPITLFLVHRIVGPKFPSHPHCQQCASNFVAAIRTETNEWEYSSATATHLFPNSGKRQQSLLLCIGTNKPQHL